MIGLDKKFDGKYMQKTKKGAAFFSVSFLHIVGWWKTDGKQITREPTRMGDIDKKKKVK